MNKIAVVYASKYGTTKQYAQWLADTLSAELFEKKAIKPSALEPFDTIIYGGGLYAGGINGVSLITNNFSRIQMKHLIVFTCGLADPTDKDNIQHIQEGLNKVFSPDMRERIAFFHLRGGMDYQKLSFMHKAMMSMLHKMLAKKDAATLRTEDRQLLETYGNKVDFSDKASIAPIVAYVQSLEAKCQS